MIELQERMKSLSASSASILTQLNELIRLKEQVREAQAAIQHKLGRQKKPALSPKRAGGLSFRLRAAE
jgi:hypothetical protein